MNPPYTDVYSFLIKEKKVASVVLMKEALYRYIVNNNNKKIAVLVCVSKKHKKLHASSLKKTC